jgi:hypothetical protein
MIEPDNPDPLAAPRGIVTALIASAAFWIALGVALWVVLR